jgi:omega-amidase
MNVIACQLDIVWEDKPANYEKLGALLAASPPRPGSLIVLPEMFATGFSMNVAATREEPGEPTCAFLASLAKRHQCTVIGGITGARAGNGASNQAIVIAADGTVLARYTKQQPFNLLDEGTHYPAGSETVIFPCGGFIVAPFVCYDLRFPELFRDAVRRGANLLVVIANWPVRRQQHWLTLLQARAIENLAYVVGVNRCGCDPQFSYPGRSVVVNPHGVIIADAGERERLLPAEIEPEEATSWRRDFPALRDAGFE